MAATALDALIADYIASNPPGCESVRDRIAAALAERGELVIALRESNRMLEAAHRQLGMYSATNPRVVKHAALLSKHQA